MPSSPYPSPLAGYETAAAQLPDDRNDDGKSFRNPQTGILSTAYEAFPEPLENGIRGGFDIHVYHDQTDPVQVRYSHDLWARIRLEFPELRIYRNWDRPVGPHPIAMFEVNVLTPAQFGAFVAWLVVWRGPLPALVHPNSTETDVSPGEREERNHVERAFWLGKSYPLDVSIFRE